MANMILEERDQQFVLYEMLEAEKLCLSERYAEFSKDTFDMILGEARKIAINELFPALVEGDRQGCRLEQGQVHAPACFHRPWKLYGEGGWIAMPIRRRRAARGCPGHPRRGLGLVSPQLPLLHVPGLTEGAAVLIEEFGTRTQKDRYLGPMLAGKWGGTMSITEPGSGTDVGSLTTKAVRQADGSYRIKGTKIFITAGDHDLAENIIQPVLARVEGDPAGTKGLSLFIVPKYLVNDDGSLGRRNDYSVGGIEEKLGLHGSATCLLNFGDNGDCYAELLGEQGQGMKIMFRMMNGARISVGMQGLTVSSMAYLHALKYAKERIQGSSLMNMQNPEAPRVAIIEHPDVRRMLMWMKTQVDSMRALMYYATHCQDLASIAATAEERIKWDGAFEILTPICKAYISDMAFRVCETAVQVHGGYGYTCDYPVEQFLRDSKIGSIYEGANGIQALDLIFRKLNMKKGAVFVHLLSQMNATANRYADNALVGDLSEDVRAAAGVLAEPRPSSASPRRRGDSSFPSRTRTPSW